MIKDFLSGTTDWLRHVWLWLLAWAKTDGDASAAAAALYRLNGHIHDNVSPAVKRGVYRFKNVMVGQLYADGYCVRVDVQQQPLECWGIGGNPCGSGCAKCGGSGVYRTVILYRFYFMVGGEGYCWHQPDDRVDWVVDMATDSDAYVPTKRGDPRPLTDRELTYYGYVCWWYLWRRGAAPRLKLFDLLRVIRGNQGGVRGRYALGLCHVKGKSGERLSFPAFPEWGLYEGHMWRRYEWLIWHRLPGTKWIAHWMGERLTRRTLFPAVRQWLLGKELK